MSHAPERKEKDCLNCGAVIYGRFCHVCGQENVVPKESFGKLVIHFFYDITHFDSKFFETVKDLFFKPGFLSKEYLLGRRASYLHPIRMYVFTSALFFIIFFSLFSADKMTMRTGMKLDKTDSAEILTDSKREALKKAKTKIDSIEVEAYYGAMNQAQKEAAMQAVFEEGLNVKSNLTGAPYSTKTQYDSVQKALPANERDGWFKRLAMYRRIELTNKYKNQEQLLLKDLLDRFIHTFPYLLFVSLPLYALFLNVLYMRRKQFYYVDHGIFLVHLYIFTFIILLVFFALGKFENFSDWDWITYVQWAVILYGIFYTIKAMHNFYRQRWGGTIVKFILLNIMAGISLIILFLLFFILTVFRI